MDADPAVSAWHESMGLSTSAILSRTQDELAEAREEARTFRAQAELYLRQRDTALHDKAVARREREILRIQLAGVVQFASAFQPGAIVVARQDVGDCVLCGRPIVRSQGAEVTPGTTDQFQHAYCPDAEEGS